MADPVVADAAAPTPSVRRMTPRDWALIGVVAALALVTDLWTKQWAWDALRPPDGGPIMLISPTLEFSFAFNTGAAFGILRDVGFGRVLFLITGPIAVAYATWITIKTPGATWLRFTSLGLVLGGAFGNLHDRLVRVDDLGRSGVVDFIKVNYPWGGSWPNFNVADMCLVVGVILLVLTLRGHARDPEAPPASSD